jgi:iron complex transport system ATP-binding protein
VLEVVLMGRYPHLGAFELESQQDLTIAREALAATGTLALEDRLFPTLSGGEKQRVIIASALAQSAGLMLLDEPTTALDPGYQIEIATLLRRLNAERGVTMAVATHDLNLAAGVCRRLVLLREGRVLAAGRTDQVLTRESVRALYDVEADVHFHDGAGHLTVVPLRRTATGGGAE